MYIEIGELSINIRQNNNHRVLLALFCDKTFARIIEIDDEIEFIDYHIDEQCDNHRGVSKLKFPFFKNSFDWELAAVYLYFVMKIRFKPFDSQDYLERANFDDLSQISLVLPLGYDVTEYDKMVLKFKKIMTRYQPNIKIDLVLLFDVIIEKFSMDHFLFLNFSGTEVGLFHFKDDKIVQHETNGTGAEIFIFSIIKRMFLQSNSIMFYYDIFKKLAYIPTIKERAEYRLSDGYYVKPICYNLYNRKYDFLESATPVNQGNYTLQYGDILISSNRYEIGELYFSNSSEYLKDEISLLDQVDTILKGINEFPPEKIICYGDYIQGIEARLQKELELRGHKIKVDSFALNYLPFS